MALPVSPVCPGSMRMSGKSCRGWTRLLAGGLGALVLGTVFAPAEAHAGCGDGLMPLHAASPRGSRTGASPEQPARRHLPCSGPSCSRVPLAPPAAPLSIPVPRGDDPGALPPPPPLASTNPFARLADDSYPAPVRYASDIYHPPR